MRAILLGIFGALFFSSTFILNRSMDLAGGAWEWSAALRYLFTLPLFLILIICQGKLKASLQHLRQNLAGYFIWSTIGFGFFYTPICLAATFGPGWMVASGWAITIICGVLLTPFFMPYSYKLTPLSFIQQIPYTSLKWSVLILIGVLLTQIEQIQTVSFKSSFICLGLILFAAFMYPLGNRKMMLVCKDQIGTIARVFNMTIASLPFWIILSIYAYAKNGAPDNSQLLESFIVAAFAGFIGTILFFSATNIVKDDFKKLAAIEATQSCEVLFALLGELLFISFVLPSNWSMLGMLLIIIGIILHSLSSTLANKFKRIKIF